jgi:hypothetical protein
MWFYGFDFVYCGGFLRAQGGRIQIQFHGGERKLFIAIMPRATNHQRIFVDDLPQQHFYAQSRDSHVIVTKNTSYFGFKIFHRFLVMSGWTHRLRHVVSRNEYYICISFSRQENGFIQSFTHASHHVTVAVCPRLEAIFSSPRTKNIAENAFR